MRNVIRLSILGVVAVSLAGLTGCDADDVDLNGEGARRYGVNWTVAKSGAKPAPAGASLEITEAAAEASSGAAGPAKSGASNTPAKGKKRKKKKGKTPAYKEGKVESGGTVSGTITLASSPSLKEIKLDRDLAKCGHEKHPSERCVFDAKKLTLSNCMVRLTNITTGKAWPEAMPAKKGVAILDQKECKYIPHVTVVRAGMKLKVGNSDAAEHNIHGYFESFATTKWNFTTPAESEPMGTSGTKMKKPGKYIVKCDIHPWMNAYAHAVANPYFQLTGIDGQFSLTDVPPGKYTLEVWHESLTEEPTMGAGGKITGYTFGEDWVESREIEVKAGETVTADFKMPIGK